MVRVNANTLLHTGTYNLSMTCLLPTAPPPTPLACGELLSGSIDVASEVDLFSFTGTANDVLDLTLTETSDWGGSSGSIDARATVFSPTGVQVALFDSNLQQQITLPETGTYVVRVNANTLVNTWTYDLGLVCPPPP